jgi:hypothetical protein
MPRNVPPWSRRERLVINAVAVREMRGRLMFGD